ncbi:MAG: MarR family transcriptional regulator [Candidatus Latescibacterota bacterium]|jgi:DNA-binding MarR family transcriptional regulator
MTAPRSERSDVLNDFLASTQIFSTAMTELLDDQIRSVLGKQYTLSQLKLLKMVDRTNAGTISKIASFLSVSNAAASKAVDRLVKRGLMKREEKKEDRRSIKLSLTEEGKRTLQKFEDILYDTLDGLFRRFTPEDLASAGKLLDMLSTDLVEVGARPGELCFRCGIYFRDKCLLRGTTKRTCYYHHGKDPSSNQ